MDPENLNPAVTETPPAAIETPPADTPPPADPAEDPMAAMDAGIAAASESPTPEPNPDDDSPEAGDPATDKPAVEGDPPAASTDEPAPDAVEAEIAELKLSDRSAKRFRDLAESEKALAPIREAAEKAGVSLDELPTVFERARERDEFIQMVSSTGATPEQFGKLLDYQSTITAAASGDMKAAEAAFAMLLPEVQALAQLLGKDVAGVADPLSSHDDLKSDVEDGVITRERALEIARSRNRERLQDTRLDEVTQAQRAEKERADGVAWLNSFDANMAASDPTYAAKRPALLAFVETIGQTIPPSKWAAAVQQYYARIPAPAPAPPQKPRPGPVRPHIPPARMEQVAYDNPMDALDAGISAASI